MTEITFIQFMANLWIIMAALFTTVVWCPFLVHVTKWHEEPPTLKKLLLMLILMLAPLMFVWLLLMVVGWV